MNFLQKKFEALPHLLVYKNLVINQLNQKIKILQSDNGGKFTSKEFNPHTRITRNSSPDNHTTSSTNKLEDHQKIN